MNDPEMRVLSDIAVKVGKLEALQDSNSKAVNDMAIAVNRLVEKLDKSDDIAKEAAQSAKSAHHRLAEQREEITNIKNGQRWLIGTTISIAGLFIAAVGFLWKLSGGG